MSWTAQDFMNVVAETNTEVDRVAAKIVTPPSPGSLTAEEEDALYASLTALRDKIKAL